MGNKHWEEQEVETLKKYFSTASSYQELQRLLSSRTISSIQQKINKYGLKKKNKWSKKEIKILRDNYPDKYLSELISLFPGRTMRSIEHKAKRVGFEKSKKFNQREIERFSRWSKNPRTWMAEEMKNLIENYAASSKLELIELIPNHRYASIQVKANSLGLHKTKDCIGKQASKNCTDRKPWTYVNGDNKTKPEIRIENILKKYKLPFKYVGNKSIWINGLNPDFINNSNNRIIEVFGRAFHDKDGAFSPPPRRTEKIRKIILSKAGYETLILWDDEMRKLSDEEIAKKIEDFNEEDK